MDKQQFATLTIGIKSAYPASKILEDSASMDFWYLMLKDIPYEVAENAGAGGRHSALTKRGAWYREQYPNMAGSARMKLMKLWMN